jgi:catechol 2,3-dioxygenase-like lactoylglutathione lyase family enzyme
MYTKYMITGLDHIQLTMPEGEEPRARAFFSGVLGLLELAKPESLTGRGGCWFACGAQELHMGVEAGFRPAKKAHPAFLVQDLNAMQARLEEAGVQTLSQPPLPGARRVFVEDPFGNRIELIERLNPAALQAGQSGQKATG